MSIYIYDSTPWAAKPGALQLLGEVGSRGMMWDIYIYIFRFYTLVIYSNDQHALTLGPRHIFSRRSCWKPNPCATCSSRPRASMVVRADVRLRRYYHLSLYLVHGI